MATERQIEANRRNAALSSGPKSAEGKAKSRANATRHGLAGESAAVEAGLSSIEFTERRAKWAAEQKPVGEAAGWALDRAVAASLRIERCERAVDNLCENEKQRARLAWDQDQAVEAATTLGRLAKNPVLVSCQLQATLAGVALLIEAWLVLVAALESGEDWSESEQAKALDLLGVATDLRAGRTPIDGDSDLVCFRRALALEEVERLEALQDEALIPLDEMNRRHAMAGDIALLSKPAKLLLRYEREAWKRYRESMQEVQNPTPEPVEVERPPAIAERPKPPKPPIAPTGPTFEEERRALQAQAAPFLKEATDRLAAMGLDEDAWLDELERRLEAAEPAGFAVTERTQFAGVAVGQ